jgi:hypothetical protein
MAAGYIGVIQMSRRTSLGMEDGNLGSLFNDFLIISDSGHRFSLMVASECF